MKNGKYFVVIFCDKKIDKVLYKCQTKNTVYDYWHEFKTQKRPPFTKEQNGKRNVKPIYELGLIFPNNKWAKPTYIRDELGRLIEAKMENPKFRIKELIPYWKEELIYDLESKKRIRYHEMMEIINKVTDIAQIFTLNNKLFLQVEDNVRMFGNKTINDANRLFNIVRNDLLKNGKGNFIFVRDISTSQRISLYTLLESKGYKRTELFRHYSY